MPVKPSNVTPAIGDRIPITGIITPASASGQLAPIFYDPLNAWKIVSVVFIPTTAYIVSQAALVSLGSPSSLTAYVNAASIGAAAIAVGTPSAPLTITSAILPAGTPLIPSWTQKAGQSGAGVLVIRLRPFVGKNAVSKSSTRAV